MRASFTVFAAVSSLLVLSGCPRRDTLTVREAQAALEESSISSQAETWLADGVEISTSFTIGDAVEKAAQQLRDFIESQLPCAEVALDGATLSIEYGKKPGNCTWNGHSFAGSHTITVMKSDATAGDVLVHHVWDDFNNGKISVSGEADVTWSRKNASRHVVHEVTWTVLSGEHAGRSGTGSGDRTQTLLAGGLSEGIRIDGSRAWEGASGRFDLDIQGVEVRWADPVPQAGAYVLTTPADKTLTLSFERVDGDTIHVGITNGQRSFGFDVSSIGKIAESGD